MKTNELAASISPRSPGGRRRIVFGRERIRIKDVVALAHGEAEASIHESIGGRDRLDSGQRLLPRLIDAGKAPIYGVTTGVGSSIGNAIPPELSDRLGSHFPRMHGCGTGRILAGEEAAAIVSDRLASLAAGHSAVGAGLLERVVRLHRVGARPCPPPADVRPLDA